MVQRTSVSENDFYPDELEIMESININFKKALVSCAKRYIAYRKELVHGTNEESYKEDRSQVAIESFVNSNIEMTQSRSDRISLRDLYDMYESYLRSKSMLPVILSKQKFRKSLESLGMVYGKADNSKNVFRYIRLLEHEDDEDWEL